ncbi:nuclear transport factor 2 family protein [Gemmatimonas sp.]|uniref:ester cyclase n=1 Tax=Gemmatimonas sp. TaxID=1962908 RepID=UPI00286AAB21|nr:nuclear transport factor 2 family protein [Gemmatimonas sp.]
MNGASAARSKWITSGVAAFLLAILIACSTEGKRLPPEDRTSFAARYADAWSGQNPVAFGAFYGDSGSLVVNGVASVGRVAIVETARSYMAAFPDMKVRLDSLREESGATVFHWTWTGTNSGPGGTGKAVNLTGFERWTFGTDGLLMKSDGHFDNDEYQRQLKGESPASR